MCGVCVCVGGGVGCVCGGVCVCVCVIFASLNAPYFENWARIPVSIFEISALGDLNKYLDDMFAITSPDPILFGSYGFV